MTSRVSTRSGVVTCPICGDTLKRITASHLKKHELTMAEFREKYGDIVAVSAKDLMADPQAFVNQLLPEVIGHMTRDESLSDLAREAVTELLKTQDAKMRVLLNVMATAKASRLDFLFGRLTEIEDLLLDPQRLLNAKDGDLITIYREVKRSMDNVTDYLKSLSIDQNKGLGTLFDQKIINIYSNDPNAPKPPKSPPEREQIRNLLGALVEAASDPDFLKGVDVVEAGFTVVDDGAAENAAKDTDEADSTGAGRPEGETPDSSGGEPPSEPA